VSHMSPADMFPDVCSECDASVSSVSVSSGDLMPAESMLSLRGSKANLRKSQWSLKGEGVQIRPRPRLESNIKPRLEYQM